MARLCLGSGLGFGHVRPYLRKVSRQSMQILPVLWRSFLKAALFYAVTREGALNTQTGLNPTH